ncbi:MAG: NERD domain-containing protein [Desulfotomaculaceae bacterium]|nr:NERD domain-containing protein [Desulfotomaculaceae bacterium]
MANWLDKTVDFLYGEERTIKSPRFIKDFTRHSKQINDLETLAKQLVNGHKKNMILKDIAYLRKGLEGESNVYYELINSFLPILCLHDIRLEYKGYTAQFDFIIISDKFICVLETKQLNGNVMINADGSFVRIIQNKDGREIKREGMYSPITQNERHLNILKQIIQDKQLMNETLYLSFVVLANPKSILHKNKCPTEIKKKIIRHDQVISTLKYYQQNSAYHKLETYLFKTAYWLKNNDKQITYDYNAKYQLTDNDFIATATQARYLEGINKKGKKFVKVFGSNEQAEIIRQKYLDMGIGAERVNKDRYGKEEFYFYIAEDSSDSSYTVKKEIACTIEDAGSDSKKDRETLVKELKEYRLKKSREEGFAAYLIFNNAEMDALITNYPTNEEELLKVKGFGKKKSEKYGQDILRIFNR